MPRALQFGAPSTSASVFGTLFLVTVTTPIIASPAASMSMVPGAVTLPGPGGKPPLCTIDVLNTSSIDASSVSVSHCSTPISSHSYFSQELPQRLYQHWAGATGDIVLAHYQNTPNLRAVHSKDFSAIPDRDDVPFPAPGFNSKARFVFQVCVPYALPVPSDSDPSRLMCVFAQFVGYREFKHQATVTRTRKGQVLQPTKGDLAVHVAKEVERFRVR